MAEETKDGYKKLAEDEPQDKAATAPKAPAKPKGPVRVSTSKKLGAAGGDFVLVSEGQHTLKWADSIKMENSDETVPPGELNLYTYPGGFSGAALDIIRGNLVQMAKDAPQVYETPDLVGAYVIHALIVCNTDASLEVAFQIIDVLPRLLLQTHSGTAVVKDIFTGEGSIHIVCVNRREEYACKMIDIAQKNFTEEEFRSFLNTPASGFFFNDAPMCWYGDTPISYACCFGLRKLVRKMLDTGLVSLNENPGPVLGFYPIHAVSTNGLRDMYDFLTTELPEGQRADRKKHSSTGRLIQMSFENMTPLQMTIKRGLKFMFQHVMKREHTRIMWVWGPVTEYQISLLGIDSAGTGANDAMEIICREDASHVTTEFILDSCMAGFLFNLFEAKWSKFGWYMHIVIRSLDAAVVATAMYISLSIKGESYGE